MPQYKPSFVDVSGMTQGLINGIEQAAQIKQQQDQLVQKQLDDYQNNYDEKKLRDSDLPDFVTAFKGYKDAALRYSRLNRGGAKPEEVALASALKDKALMNLNTIYKNSSAAKNLINERVQYRNDLYKQNRAMPSQVSDEVMYLTTTPASEIDFNKFDSPYKLPLKAGKESLKRFEDTLKAIPIGEGLAYEDPNKSIKFNVTGYGNVELPYMVTPKGRSKKAVLDATAGLMSTNADLANTAQDMYDEIKAGLQIPENIADPVLLSRRKLAMNQYDNMTKGLGISDDEFSPQLVLAASTGLLTPNVGKQGLDQTKLKAVFQDMKNKLGEKKFKLAASNLGLQFDKFASAEDRNFINTILKPGSELIPSVGKKINAQNIDVKAVRKAQADAKKKKSSRLGAFTGQ